MTALRSTESRVRHGVRVKGVVQGVGFRPFVYRLATELGLSGEVGNDSAGVFLEVEGPAGTVAVFEERLLAERPPLARIEGVTTIELSPTGAPDFHIRESRSAGAVETFVPPDVAVCDDCLGEMFESSDRRYRYAFINCTNCGPRFTITRGLPYDRANTTMAAFPMCPACAGEYHDPASRRYHAQPIACPACGPRVWFRSANACEERPEAAISAAREALCSGAIVAIKGLGGYHLACDASSDAAVKRLRQKKGRSHKPFAVMVADLAAANDIADMSPDEAAALSGPVRPIVLLSRLEESRLSPLIAPGNPLVGLMLAYTPLHHLLFSSPSAGRTLGALVMTSGNLSEEPICYEDAEAERRLGHLADAFLLHDRPIHVPCDDSVIRLDGRDELPIRRSRGYAPLPLRLPISAPPLLATGGELKNTFCLVSGRDAWMSQHIGDMGSLETLLAYDRSISQFQQAYEVSPGALATDAHPRYQVRRWAEERSRPVCLVQHHHAHVASVMAEHGLSEQDEVVGCAFDGTGYGTDGAIWGGEFLLASYGSFERAAHLSYVSLPGGDAAVRRPRRVALAHLHAAGVEWSRQLPPVEAATGEELTVLRRQLERGFGCSESSSAGRLFDAISSLVGICHEATYEAQAAIELEAAAMQPPWRPRRYAFSCVGRQIDSAPVVRAVAEDVLAGVETGEIAAGFHLAVAQMIGQVATTIAGRAGIGTVALSGGVFQNLLLLRLARRELEDRGLRVLTHRFVPPNDGGLALGQAAVAAALSRRGGAPKWMR